MFSVHGRTHVHRHIVCFPSVLSVCLYTISGKRLSVFPLFATKVCPLAPCPSVQVVVLLKYVLMSRVPVYVLRIVSDTHF